MKDAPSFNWYPERWLAGTADMTEVERARYFQLLCHSWLRDGLPNDPAVLARLAGGKLSDAVLSKFPVCEDGLRRNARLEAERAEQRERITKARASANARWGKNKQSSICSDDANASVEHMRTHNLSITSPLTTHHSPQSVPLALPNSVTTSEPTRPAERPRVEVEDWLPNPNAAEAESIVRLYPANGNRYEAQRAVLEAIKAGESPQTIRSKVEAHAAKFRALHPSQRRFCPGLAVYFSEGRWNDDPEGHPWTITPQLTKEQEQKLAVKAAAARIEKPTLPTIRAVDPAQRPTLDEFASIKDALRAGQQCGDGGNQDRREEGAFPAA